MRTGLMCRAILLAAIVVVSAVSAPEALAADRKPDAAEAGSRVSALVDVNAATREELVAVPGIGETLAGRIVEFRSKNGPFQRVDDLLKVRGIGEKSLEKLRPYLRAGAAK